MQCFKMGSAKEREIQNNRILDCLLFGLVLSCVHLGFGATLVAAAQPEPDAPVQETQGTPSDSSEVHAAPTQKGLGAAKISRNPLANTIILPLQFNINLGTGPNHDSTQVAPNFQPLIPFSLSDHLNLITRTVLPYIWQPEVAPGVGPASGLGDLNFTPWLSPVPRGGLVWGVGPALLFPTATNQLLGTGKFCVGPSAVVAWVGEQWLVGMFAQNIWSYAGDSDRKSVSQMATQAFVNFALGREWYLTSVPLITADWLASDGNKWTVPLGGGMGHIVRLGQQPVDLTVQAFYNVVRPQAGAEWQLRFTVNLILPPKHQTKKKETET